MNGIGHHGNTAESLLGARLQSFVHTQLLLAQEHLARSGDERHRGVHEARKCLRRTRAALALGTKPMRKALASSDLELHRICRGLSAVRDAQALIEALCRIEGKRGLSPYWYARSLEAVTQLRDEVLERALLRDVDFAKRRRRIAAIDARLTQRDWTAFDQATAHSALNRSERRMRKARRCARKNPEHAAAWHTFRRRLRRLRQQITLLKAIAPELTHIIDGRKHEAAVLSQLQDDALLLARCGGRSPFPIQSRPQLRKLARQRLARHHAKFD